MVGTKTNRVVATARNPDTLSGIPDERDGRVNVVINNAGDGEARALMDTNFWGVVDVTKRALGAFRGDEDTKAKGGGGVVLQVSSMGGAGPGSRAGPSTTLASSSSRAGPRRWPRSCRRPGTSTAASSSPAASRPTTRPPRSSTWPAATQPTPTRPTPPTRCWPKCSTSRLGAPDLSPRTWPPPCTTS